MSGYQGSTRGIYIGLAMWSATRCGLPSLYVYGSVMCDQQPHLLHVCMWKLACLRASANGPGVRSGVTLHCIYIYSLSKTSTVHGISTSAFKCYNMMKLNQL